MFPINSVVIKAKEFRITVEDDSWIGDNVTILDGVRLEMVME